MEKIYLITGATGLVGTNLVKRLQELHKKIRVLVLPNENIKGFDTNEIEVIRGNVCDVDSLRNFFKKDNAEQQQVCLHCAGIVTISKSSKNNDNLVHNVNVNGTKNIVNQCMENKVNKLVYVSSVHAIKELPMGIEISETNHFDPDDVEGLYAKTKSEATQEVLKASQKGLNATVVHPSGIIGPYDYNQGNFTSLILCYVKGKLPAVVNGGYDFVDVRDVAEGIIKASEKGKSGECYILSNQYYSVKKLIHMISEVTGQKEVKTVLPRWFIVPLAPLAELYYKVSKEKPLFTAYSLRVLSSNSNFSHQKATDELDYQPRPLQRTLKDTIDWMKKEQKI